MGEREYAARRHISIYAACAGWRRGGSCTAALTQPFVAEKMFPGCKVIEGGGTDYNFRTTVDRIAAASQIANAVLAID